MLSFAHPDDESFCCGATIAKYVKEGWRVDLVCATKGEVGNSGPYTATGEALGAIRQRELEKAGTILGISSITFLGYTDGTLAGLHSGELEDKIYEKMEELVPDIVITFDTTGVSNHPDHIKICYATTFAFQKYAFWIQNRLSGAVGFDEEQLPKLYYACTPESIVNYLKKKKVFPDVSFNKPWLGTPDKFITTAISAKGFQTIKKQALRTHISQQQDVDRFLSLSKNPLASCEYFILRMHGTREVFMGKNDRVAAKL